MTDHMHSSNGPAGDDDAFERDLKEMLKDGPSLGDLSSTVQTGNTNPASVDLGTGMPRSYPPPSSLPAGGNMPRNYPAAAAPPNNMGMFDVLMLTFGVFSTFLYLQINWLRYLKHVYKF